MGTIFTPTYVTLTMGYFEVKLYWQIKNWFTMARYEFMENWKRCFDCEIFWSAGRINLSSLPEILNSVHPTIEFIMEVSENNLLFLDIIIHKYGNKIFIQNQLI